MGKETIKSRDYERRNLSKTYRLSAKQNLEIIKISNALAQGKSVSVGFIASVLTIPTSLTTSRENPSLIYALDKDITYNGFLAFH